MCPLEPRWSSVLCGGGFAVLTEKAVLSLRVHSSQLVLRHTVELKERVGLLCKLKTSAKRKIDLLRIFPPQFPAQLPSLVVIFV